MVGHEAHASVSDDSVAKRTRDEGLDGRSSHVRAELHSPRKGSTSGQAWGTEPSPHPQAVAFHLLGEQ